MMAGSQQSKEMKNQDEMSKYRSPSDKEETGPARSANPQGLVPAKGQMRNRPIKTAISFDLDR